MRRVALCCIVNSEALGEFMILKQSIESFYDCQWYISCNRKTSDILKNEKNINCFNLLNENKVNHGVDRPEKNESFYTLLKTKFTILKIALKEESYAIFLDTDMIFVHKMDDNILNLVENKIVNVCVTPHFSHDRLNEARVGFYNAGMILVNKIGFIEKWEEICNSEKSMYYEQPPLEKALETETALTLPITYNMGWWRFKKGFGEDKLNNLYIDEEGDISFANMKVINFHLHLEKKLSYPNFGEPLKNKLLELSNSNIINNKVKEIILLIGGKKDEY